MKHKYFNSQYKRADMFSLFKSDPSKKLHKSYAEKLEQAMQAQRSGDIRGYAELTEQAEQIKAQLDALEAEKGTR